MRIGGGTMKRWLVAAMWLTASASVVRGEAPQSAQTAATEAETEAPQTPEDEQAEPPSPGTAKEGPGDPDSGWEGFTDMQVGGGPSSSEASEVVFEAPPESSLPPLDTAPRVLAVEGPGPSGGDSPDATPLRGARALAMKRGEARLLLAGGERLLRPGDVVGWDTVVSVEPGCIKLERSAAAPTGAAEVVLRVDGEGRTRLRVYLLEDPTPAARTR